jgi:hypothetical protein
MTQFLCNVRHAGAQLFIMTGEKCKSEFTYTYSTSPVFSFLGKYVHIHVEHLLVFNITSSFLT